MKRLPHYLGATAHYYRQWLLRSTVAGVVLTFLLYLAKDAGLLPPSWWFTRYLLWIGYVLLWMAAGVIHWVHLVASFRSVYIDTIEGHWYFTSKTGDLSSDFTYRRVTNPSSGPVKEFRPDREGFTVDTDYQPTYHVVERSEPTQAVRVVAESAFKQTTLVDAREVRYWVYEKLLHFVPPLGQGQQVSILRSYDARGTEKDAFSPTGTYAGIRIFYPTRVVHLRLFAQPHFRIELLSHHVVNESGVESQELRVRYATPRIQANGALLEWTILYPRNSLRFVFKYRLNKR